MGRQQRLINFVTPQLEANEQVVAILTRAYHSVNPWMPLGPTAVVATNRRVFAIRLRRISSRPKATLATYARDGVTIEWIRNAITFRSQSGGPVVWDMLSIRGSFGMKEFWVGNQAHAEAVAKALNAVGT